MKRRPALGKFHVYIYRKIIACVDFGKSKAYAGAYITDNIPVFIFGGVAVAFVYGIAR